MGLDKGKPQSVYILDKTRLNQITKADGSPLRLTLSPGQVADLPGKRGSIEFVGLRQFARLQIASTPFAALPLMGTSLGVLGLIASLMIRPRRLWIKARRHGGRTVVEVAGLSRVARGNIGAEINSVVEALQQTAEQQRPEPTSEETPANSAAVVGHDAAEEPGHD